MARARGPAQAGPGAPRAGQASFAGDPARCSGAAPAGPAGWGARDAGRCVSGAHGEPLFGPAGSLQRRDCPGPAGRRERPPSESAAARASAHRPGTPSGRAGPEGAAPQTAARARSAPELRRPRNAGRVELRAAEAAQAAGAGPGFLRPPGSGWPVPRRGRRARGAGGAARGPSPCKAAALPAGARRRCRRAPPHSRAPRAASPFRALHAAAILFISSPSLRRRAAARPSRTRPSRRRRARPLAELPGLDPRGAPRRRSYWAVWIRAGARAGIGSRWAPPQGWIQFVHWPEEAPVTARGRKAGAGKRNPGVDLGGVGSRGRRSGVLKSSMGPGECSAPGRGPGSGTLVPLPGLLNRNPV